MMTALLLYAYCSGLYSSRRIAKACTWPKSPLRSRRAHTRRFSSIRPAGICPAGFVMPPNITLIPLPAKCPELNPQENVWQFLRDNWLSNPIFKSYDDVINHCCGAWNKLVDQPWRIMSIGLRNWAHGS